MIGGPGALHASLGAIYNENKKAISQSMARIASGKRIQKPSDDFAGFLRSSELLTDVAGYRLVKQDLTTVRGLAAYAAQTGSDIADDLSRMKELVKLYAVGDDDQRASYTSEFNALKVQITSTAQDAAYDGAPVVQAGTLSTTHLEPTHTGGTLSISFAEEEIVDVSALTISAGTALADVQAQINKASSYLFTAESHLDSIDRHIVLTDIIINSKEAASSLITDIDEVTELASLTSMQIRQQAASAMLAQANVIQAYAARLYDGTQN